MEGENQLGIREDIQRLYRQEPNLSGKEVLARLGKEDTPRFWKILNQEQVKIRGAYPSRHKNRNKGAYSNPNASKGMVRFIPPETKDA